MNIKEEYFDKLTTLEMEEIKDMIVNLLNKFDVSYELEYRNKELAKLKRKIEYRKGKGFKNENILNIPDIIGFRIVVESEEDVLKIRDILNNTRYDRIIDNFNFPKESGFRDFAYYYACFGFNTEIQIMTKSMRDWTNATHEEYEMRKYGDLVRSRGL